MLEVGRPEASACAVEGTGLVAAMDALRARGAPRIHPVRFRFVECLARRAAAHEGDARRLLDDRLARLIAALGEDLDRAGVAAGAAGPPAAAGAARRGALAELVDHVARQSPGAAAGPSAREHATPPGRGAPAELEALAYFRRTWSRLSAQQRLAQSLATLPNNAGPLNSHHLVHRALTAMRELSPEYLDQFMSHVDALLWLDLANGNDDRETSQGSRSDGERKLARGRRK